MLPIHYFENKNISEERGKEEIWQEDFNKNLLESLIIVRM